MRGSGVAAQKGIILKEVEDKIDKYDREALIDYLRQYNRCREAKERLEERYKRIKADFNNPLKSPVLSDQPKSPGYNTESKTVTMVVTLEDIEIRINNQLKLMAKSLMRIMEVIEFLEVGSDERNVIELEYIDNKKIEEIERKLHMSRASVYRAWNRAIANLMSFPKVIKIIENYKEEDKRNGNKENCVR